MKTWQTLSSEEVYETPWIKVRRDEVLNHNSKKLTYSVISLHHPSVFIIATNAKGHIYAMQNYRYTIDQVVWEFPAGHSDGEEMLAAAKRELLEETGLVSEDWTNLGTLYQATGIGNIPLVAFLARNAQQAITKSDQDEAISNGRFFDITQLEKMAINNDFVEAPALAMLYLAKLHGLTKEEK